MPPPPPSPNQCIFFSSSWHRPENGHCTPKMWKKIRTSHNWNGNVQRSWCGPLPRSWVYAFVFEPRTVANVVFGFPQLTSADEKKSTDRNEVTSYYEVDSLDMTHVEREIQPGMLLIPTSESTSSSRSSSPSPGTHNKSFASENGSDWSDVPSGIVTGFEMVSCSVHPLQRQLVSCSFLC